MTKPDKKEDEKPLSEEKSKFHKTEAKEKKDTPAKEETTEDTTTTSSTTTLCLLKSMRCWATTYSQTRFCRHG